MAIIQPLTPGQKVKLAKIDPGDTHGVKRPETAAEYELILDRRLPDLQDLLYASACNSVLIVLQGLDTAGKDGTIKHVMARLNPEGCRVDSFKAPTPEELSHDFLWRAHKVTPALGWMEIFNRSHYEDVLVTRVDGLVPKDVWKGRYREINEFERLLARSGTIILKFFLYISKEEQRARLLAREEDKSKAWKLSTSDWVTHEKYDAYIDAYGDALEGCSTEEAPWYVIPSNKKWFRNLAVAQTIADALHPYESAWHGKLEERGTRILAELKAMREAKKPVG